MDQKDEFYIDQKVLIDQLDSMSKKIHFSNESKALIVSKLDSTKKIMTWFVWIHPRFHSDGVINVTENEAVDAAITISEGGQLNFSYNYYERQSFSCFLRHLNWSRKPKNPTRKCGIL